MDLGYSKSLQLFYPSLSNLDLIGWGRVGPKVGTCLINWTYSSGGIAQPQGGECSVDLNVALLWQQLHQLPELF